MNKYTGENPEFITIEEGPLEEELHDDLQEDMSQEAVDEFNEDFAANEKTPEEKSKRRKIRRIALLVAAGIATGAVGGHLAHQTILDRQDYERAINLTNGYRSFSACLLPERIFTNQNHDYQYTSGKHLVEAMEKKNESIIRVGDIFVTPNGENVVKLVEEIERRYYKPIQVYEMDGQSFVSEPNGYTYDANNGSCVKIETEIVELYTYATESMHDVEWGTAPYPNSRVKQVLSYEKYESISYEEAKKMNLIVDVNDSYAYSDGTQYNEAQLKLVPNNQK